MSHKHAPGPWHWAGEGILMDRDGLEIPSGEFFGDNPNGTLISAAPEMLEALKGMINWARRVKVKNPGPEIVNAIADIAKAEGRTQ